MVYVQIFQDYMSIKEVLFDMDGVLVGLPETHYQALNKALGVFGHSIGRDDHIAVYNGLPTKQKLKIMADKGILPKGLCVHISELKKRYTAQLAPSVCKPSHDKQLLLKYLKDKGIKLACCSNAIRTSVEYVLNMLEVTEYFDEIIGNDEGFSPKPSPDIYVEAMRRLHVLPEDTIIVEDSPHGIEAAQKSGAFILKVKDEKDVNISLLEKLL